MLTNIIQKIKVGAIYAALCIGLVAMPLAMTTSVAAVDPVTNAKNGVSAVAGAGGGDFAVFIKDIINILLFLIGSIAVIMIIVGGIRYVVSNGEQAAITGAKNTILYAVVGLVVAVMAYAIVNFVLKGL
jgi:hypothetical protein